MVTYSSSRIGLHYIQIDLSRFCRSVNLSFSMSSIKLSSCKASLIKSACKTFYHKKLLWNQYNCGTIRQWFNFLSFNHNFTKRKFGLYRYLSMLACRNSLARKLKIKEAACRLDEWTLVERSRMVEGPSLAGSPHTQPRSGVSPASRWRSSRCGRARGWLSVSR